MQIPFFEKKRISVEGKELLSYRVLAQWLWRTSAGYRLQATINTIIGVILVLTDLAFVWGTKWAVDIATNSNNKSLKPAILFLGVIIITQILLGITSRWVRAILGVKAQNKMQHDAFSHLLRSDWKSMQQFHTGNLINRIETDVNNIIGFITESIPSLFTTVFQFIGAFLFLFYMDKALACVIILVIPFFLISSKLYVRKMRTLTRTVRDTESKIQSIIQESLQHTMVIKTLGRTQTILEKLSATQKQLRKEIVTKTKYATISSSLMNAGFATGYLLTFTWGTVSLHRGLITYGALIAFVQLVSQIQGPVKQLTRFIPVFISSFTATERLIELDNIPLERNQKDLQVEPSAGICIKNIIFCYSETSRKIFDNFSFNFPVGSITAILGETGSGKTTLIRLLLSLIAPKEGSIILQDKNKEVPISPETRCNFAYVPQGNTLLSGSIRENLLLGSPSASEEDMKLALQDAAAEFVLSLPESLDTICGEMGHGLSEGQAQRIAIARALLNPAPILLLDEATSALDAETENRVIKRIIQKYQNRTIIFVTHRPEILKYSTQTLSL
ncbi:ABC transporter ATP-binding protein [Alloprevotella rava]|uniref:ABC-type multidrug transport system fused ATPase/permease subunit n=1 Tax=Alloprevotella rava TaxID=671218 RepID=A0A7W5UG44_9BACT|nr:ABC transporter ATP-binding protein [Alloprevotella rava]MBB3703664.1 ABC-type multidrug transport system fused ATPase/permease subunit [Alloprevotella rava]